MKKVSSTRYLIVICVVAGLLVVISHAASTSGPTAPVDAKSWDPKRAAAYLDKRETWWAGWQDAQRDHGTFCVSCHTAVPYALARPALRKTLSETNPTDNERLLIENVAKRVRMWKDIAPVYNDKEDGANKSAESRATEAILNAFVLANHDAETGKLSNDTRAAFDNLWALQRTSGEYKGAWQWQLFDLNPWEGNISPYNGATLGAIAVGVAPEKYRSAPEIQNNLKLLREYLDREYSSQPTLNRITLLWAAAKVPGLISAERQKSIIDEIMANQQADGGWSLFSISKTWKDWGPSALLGNWKRRDGSLQDLKSDGFATGLIVYVLRQTGMPKEDARLLGGREWLIQNQNKTEGLWSAASLNKRRDPTSNVGLFMSDAATAYAALALSDAN